MYVHERMRVYEHMHAYEHMYADLQTNEHELTTRRGGICHLECRLHAVVSGKTPMCRGPVLRRRRPLRLVVNPPPTTTKL